MPGRVRARSTAKPGATTIDRMNTIALDTPTPRSRGLMPPRRTIAKDAAHLVLGLPVGIFAFTVIVTGLSLGAGLAITLVVTLWSTALGLVTSPLWLWALEEEGDPPIIDDPGLGYSVLRVVIGIVLVPVAAWGSRATAAASGRLARAILG
jgi:hypothetical protein